MGEKDFSCDSRKTILNNKDLGYGVIDDYVRFNLTMFEYS